MNTSSWPSGQPAEERQLLSDALGRCETDRQAENVLGMFLLCDLLAEILAAPPIRPVHWWQFWRTRKASR